MTCLEKLKLDNPQFNDDTIDYIVCAQCPNDEWGIPIMDPEYCAADNNACRKCWNRQIPGSEPDPQSTDAVNHPKHYGREGAMECIDEMVLVFGVEATKHFCLLNAWKYRYRAADKNGVEDLKKSDWYLAKYAELNGGDHT